MNPPAQNTAFAPAERDAPRAVRTQSQLLSSVPMLRELYDAVSQGVVIINRHRQIVFCNRHLAELLGLDDPAQASGRRLGEAVGCVYACRTPGGCGTTRFCSACGAVRAMLSGIQGEADTKECHILRDGRGEALDLLVSATPLTVQEEPFTVLAITDIGHLNRRRALERVFFHDVMNTVSSLQMLSQFLASDDMEKMHRAAEGLLRGVKRLVDEISSQRELLAAESGELPVTPTTVRSRDLLRSLVDTHGHTRPGQGPTVVIDPAACDAEFECDVGIVTRVLGNMVANAVEASEAGRPVTIGCDSDGREIRFHVHNDGHIPEDVQLQIFQRSFSTKGPGRGLGTYSMRLLSERYLNGRVDFETSPESGTTFTACFPLEF